MKYFLIIFILASCSSARKATNQQKQEVKKSSYSSKDSTGTSLVDSSSEKNSISWITTVTDSGYEKVIEEEIKEVIDSQVIHRETKRTIKEKGQKITEQSSATIEIDSTAKQVQEQARVKRSQKQDSTVVSETKNKEVKRTTFLPWWIWLIALVAAGIIAWWKKNWIINFLT